MGHYHSVRQCRQSVSNDCHLHCIAGRQVPENPWRFHCRTVRKDLANKYKAALATQKTSLNRRKIIYLCKKLWERDSRCMQHPTNLLCSDGNGVPSCVRTANHFLFLHFLSAPSGLVGYELNLLPLTQGTRRVCTAARHDSTSRLCTEMLLSFAYLQFSVFNLTHI